MSTVASRKKNIENCDKAIANAKKEAINWAQANCRTGAGNAAYGLVEGNIKKQTGCVSRVNKWGSSIDEVARNYEDYNESIVRVRCDINKQATWKENVLDITPELRSQFKEKGWDRKIDATASSQNLYTHHVSCKVEERQSCLKDHKFLMLGLGCTVKESAEQPEFGPPVSTQNYAIETACLVSAKGEGLACDGVIHNIRTGWKQCQASVGETVRGPSDPQEARQ